MFLHIRHLHISHNIPYLPPKILRKHRFQFLLGRLKYPGEMKSKSYAKFGGGGGGGANKVHYGRCASGVFIFECNFNKNRTKEKVLCERREAR